MNNPFDYAFNITVSCCPTGKGRSAKTWRFEVTAKDNSGANEIAEGRINDGDKIVNVERGGVRF